MSAEPDWDGAEGDEGKQDYILRSVCVFNLGGDSAAKPGASGFRKLKRKMQTNLTHNPISLFNFPVLLLYYKVCVKKRAVS